ncbi:MAG: PilZ domain-containing protein [Candidatus Thiodiazotropha sp. (ex Semelilucina semeliformis)]|nr:PilZ domain-containing protein [Candidatus Thiodiazotropha sp. (ex Myrtea spinifera)]MCU7806446.1 PilZ domain-containing protein [Candidatus Thiodiazotropha sp. (ex Semelilucina semeliformis)]MCU7829936.1 PilZ domain-containing protein [Candidatus Thiodiazotropha sp. (ex Myrtea sp. 'scaly one' KF741663)]
MRLYIRHPSDVPIDFQLGGRADTRREHLSNYSDGGLCFVASQWVEPGLEIHFAIPITPPQFHATGVVVWCRREGEEYQVGVKFTEEETAYAVRMVEQLCYIEHYRQSVRETEGRQLSGEEAALEWIDKYADHFPN